MSNKIEEVAKLLGVKLYEKFFTTEDEKFYYFTDNCLMCGNYAVNSSADYPVSDSLVHLLNGSYKIIRIIPDKLVEKAIQGKKLNSKEWELLLYNPSYFNLKYKDSFIKASVNRFLIVEYNDKFYCINYTKINDEFPSFKSTKMVEVVPKEIKKTIWEEVK